MLHRLLGAQGSSLQRIWFCFFAHLRRAAQEKGEKPESQLLAPLFGASMRLGGLLLLPCLLHLSVGYPQGSAPARDHHPVVPSPDTLPQPRTEGKKILHPPQISSSLGRPQAAGCVVPQPYKKQNKTPNQTKKTTKPKPSAVAVVVP